MSALITVALNALMLFGITYFLPYDANTKQGILAIGGWQLYLVAGIVLWLLNAVLRPILSILGFPFMILTLGAFTFVINGVILALLERVVGSLGIPNIVFAIHGWIEFGIAVAIFTVFNTITSVFFRK